MGVNKIEYGGDILIDLTGDTITEEYVVEGKTFHSADGEQKTGNLKDMDILRVNNLSPTVDATYIRFETTTKYPMYLRKNCTVMLRGLYSEFGDATAKDVVEGKTFTSAAGLKKVGTHVCSGGGTSPNLQNKSVAPSESAQTVTADSGYDGLSQVDVGAIPSTYVGSGVTKKSAATITPGTTAQKIAAGQYLEGDQTIEAVPTETKEITVNGTYTPTSGKFFDSVIVNVPSSGGSGTDNCEAYHITATTDVINFNGSGTVKVWGYGAVKGTYTTTIYAFVGDGYYKSASYGTPTKTSATFSIASDGTLSGLPSGLTSLDLIVEIGV